MYTVRARYGRPPLSLYSSLDHRGHDARSSKSTPSLSTSRAKPASTSHSASSTPSATPAAESRVSWRERALVGVRVRVGGGVGVRIRVGVRGWGWGRVRARAS